MTVPKNMQTDIWITTRSQKRFGIRPARAEHIPQLVDDAREMFLSAFSEAYKQVDYFEDYVQEAFTIEQFEQEFKEAKTEFWIIWDGEHIAGYIKLKLDMLPPNESQGKGLEIKRFYLHQAYHGTGLAQELMQFCLKKASKNKCRIVWLGVWPQNHKAIRFYKKYDFKVDGEVPFKLGNVVEWDWIMKKVL